MGVVGSSPLPLSAVSQPRTVVCGGGLTHLPFSGIITVLDAKYAEKNISEKKPEGVVNEAVRQVALADLLILNKTDLVDQQQLEQVSRLVRTINSSAEIVNTQRCRVELEKLLDLHAYDKFGAAEYERTLSARFEEDLPHLDQRVGTVTLEVEGSLTPTSLDDLVEVLLWERSLTTTKGHHPVIYRMKGILSVVGEDRRVMLQAVQELYEAEAVDPWPMHSPRSCKFVFIGEHLEKDILQKFLQSLMVEEPSGVP
ncbi:COBW domain-containing protein 1 [Chionoecetes opilio]|uniref:COBW domain-containing protein 1 n=1 Tax=Chionoecetes opilio TaxID=41210 RepID=A0A8J8W9K0_CHIOP|nr:COBW domain-containing protein 1 [Chionoecetes opilio]